MSELAELQHQIAYAMIAMAPEEAETLIFQGSIYAESSGDDFFWLTKDGTEDGPKLGEQLNHYRNQVLDAMYAMQKIDPFAQQEKVFTHFQVTLKRDTPNIAIDLEYISEEQSYPGVYMRPVGALTEAEAKALYVPYDEWHIRKQLYDGEITEAEFDAEILRRDEAWEAEVKAREM